MAPAGCEHVDDRRGRFFQANVRIDAGAKQCFELEMDDCHRFAQPKPGRTAALPSRDLGKENVSRTADRAKDRGVRGVAFQFISQPADLHIDVPVVLNVS